MVSAAAKAPSAAADAKDVGTNDYGHRSAVTGERHFFAGHHTIQNLGQRSPGFADSHRRRHTQSVHGRTLMYIEQSVYGCSTRIDARPALPSPSESDRLPVTSAQPH